MQRRKETDLGMRKAVSDRQMGGSWKGGNSSHIDERQRVEWWC